VITVPPECPGGILSVGDKSPLQPKCPGSGHLGVNLIVTTRMRYKESGSVRFPKEGIMARFDLFVLLFLATLTVAQNQPLTEELQPPKKCVFSGPVTEADCRELPTPLSTSAPRVRAGRLPTACHPQFHVRHHGTFATHSRVSQLYIPVGKVEESEPA
jgi:hypothetical protein